MRRNIRIIVVFALVAAAHPASTDPTLISVKVYGGLFSVDIPDDWREIDPLHLDELTMWSADVTAGRLVEVYQHGFRPRESDADPLLPHILVQIRESGRLRYGEFLHLQPLNELQSAARKTFPKGIPPLVMGVAVERVSFNASTFCLRLEHNLDLRFKGRVRVMTAAFLTERGLVTIHFADRERRIEKSRALFDRIVRSIVIEPEIAYRPHLRDRWPGLPFFGAAALTAAGLIAYLVRRRRSPS